MKHNLHFQCSELPQVGLWSTESPVTSAITQWDPSWENSIQLSRTIPSTKIMTSINPRTSKLEFSYPNLVWKLQSHSKAKKNWTIDHLNSLTLLGNAAPKLTYLSQLSKGNPSKIQTQINVTSQRLVLISTKIWSYTDMGPALHATKLSQKTLENILTCLQTPISKSLQSINWTWTLTHCHRNRWNYQIASKMRKQEHQYQFRKFLKRKTIIQWI